MDADDLGTYILLFAAICLAAYVSAHAIILLWGGL